MWHSLTAAIVVAAVSSYGVLAQPQSTDTSSNNELSGKEATPVAARPERTEGYVESASQTTASCSCDCCQVTKLSPVDQQPLANGDVITSACGKSVADVPIDGTVSSDGNDICPDVCQIPTSNEIIFSNKGELDYNRFCGLNCQPVTDAQGTSCVQLQKKDYSAMHNTDGNGNFKPLPPVLGIGSGYGVKEIDEGSKKDEITIDVGISTTPLYSLPSGVGDGSPTTATAPAVRPANAVDIVYDLRRLIAERLRSEAGASVSQAASSAENVRINNFKAKEDLDVLKKLTPKISATAGKVEAGVSAVAKQKNAASESESKVKKALAEGQKEAGQIVRETIKLTIESLKKEITPLAERAAQINAEAKGLDKPDDWDKVVAARAANPYQVAVSAAVQRSDEYKRYADGLMEKAFKTQQEANSLFPQANALQAQGDAIGASIERKQAANLLARARSIAADAQAAQGVAEKTRKTIPRWQEAAGQAAAYAAWEYTNNAKAFR